RLQCQCVLPGYVLSVPFIVTSRPCDTTAASTRAMVVSVRSESETLTSISVIAASHCQDAMDEMIIATGEGFRLSALARDGRGTLTSARGGGGPVARCAAG